MSIGQRLAALQRITRGELHDEWRRVMGEEPRSGNVAWMRKRLAWAIQAKEYGGLSEAAERRIEELTPVALQWLPWGFKSFPERNATVSPAERGRLAPGTTVVRSYRGRTLELLVRDDGFELAGVVYPSLSAAAKGATGSHWNGTLFWFGRSRKSA